MLQTLLWRRMTCSSTFLKYSLAVLVQTPAAYFWCIGISCLSCILTSLTSYLLFFAKFLSHRVKSEKVMTENLSHPSAPVLSFLFSFFLRNARYNHDNWSRRIKTQFLSGTKLREIWQYVQRTWKCPDFRKKQKGGRRVLIKKFNHPLGEYSFFDREGKLQSISIYTLKVVYDRNWNGNVVYITAYPLFWRPKV